MACRPVDVDGPGKSGLGYWIHAAIIHKRGFRDVAGRLCRMRADPGFRLPLGVFSRWGFLAFPDPVFPGKWEPGCIRGAGFQLQNRRKVGNVGFPEFRIGPFFDLFIHSARVKPVTGRCAVRSGLN